MANQIDYVSDWAARLKSRLYTQFRSATTWQQWCDEVLGPQIQDLEDAGQTLLSLLDIDESVGVQLDNIGRIVGQPRNGVSDVLYRLYLSARILANKSDGSPEDIFNVMRALFGAGITYVGGLLKDFSVRITPVITPAEAKIGIGFLRDSEEAGARGIFEWQESADTSMFHMRPADAGSSYSTTSAANYFVGNTTIRINNPGTQPDSGLVVIGDGASDEEWVLFDTWDTNGPSEHRLYLHTGLINAHTAGATVKFIIGDGYGFGDVNDSTVGGTLGGAAQA